MALLETIGLVVLVASAVAKWVFTNRVDTLRHEIETGKQRLKDARDSLKRANSKRSSLRQDLARTVKQVDARSQDVTLLKKRLELEEAQRLAEQAQFEKLKEAVAPRESFSAPESRVMFK